MYRVSYRIFCVGGGGGGGTFSLSLYRRHVLNELNRYRVVVGENKWPRPKRKPKYVVKHTSM